MAKVLVTESYISDIASAIRSKNGQSASYTPSQMASAIGSIISAGALSIISKAISSNGTYSAEGENADAFSSVVIDVPNTYSVGDEGKVVSEGSLVVQGSMNISANSTYDTTLFSQVTVNVESTPMVLVSKTISENGTYNPSDDSADAYSQVVVSVSGGGGGAGLPIEILQGGLVSFYDSSVTSIQPYAFFSQVSLQSIQMDSVLTIGNSVFLGCSSLKTVVFPACTEIGISAFYGQHAEGMTISFPEVVSVGNCAFAYARISEANFPKCVSLGSNVFQSCGSLVSVSFPELVSIKTQCFSSCVSLQSIILPKASSIPTACFYNCRSLSYASFSSCKSIANNVFYSCYSLRTIIFNELVSVGTMAFAYCRMLESLYIFTSSVPVLQSKNAFVNTPLSNLTSYLGHYGSIYVPASLVDFYKSAPNWSDYADRITSYVEE